MSVIGTNVSAMFAQAALTTNQRNLERASNQISTGKRIYTAAVDAAGVAISNKLTSQVRGNQMVVRNLNDAISFMQTAEGGLNEIANMAQRMRELQVQASNGTWSATQTASISAEMTSLSTGITAVIAASTWNGLNLISASAATTLNATVNQDGTTAAFSITSVGTTPTSASTVANLDTYIAAVGTARADAGANINRMAYLVDNLNNAAANLAQSNSRVQDTDYAKASADLAKAQIINQAATAMLAQANQQPQGVLALLR